MANLMLKELYVEGFRGFETSFRFGFQDGRNILKGENGQGKSSIGEAIAWAFTGKGIGGATQNLNVRHIHAKRARVVIQFTLDGQPREIERRQTEGGTTTIMLDGEKITQKSLEGEFNSMLMLLLLNPMIFLSLSESTSRTLILNLFPNIDPETVLNNMSKEERENIEKVGANLLDTNLFLKDANKRRQTKEDEVKHMMGYIQKVSEPVIVPPFVDTKPFIAETQTLQRELEELITKRPDAGSEEERKQKLAELDRMEQLVKGRQYEGEAAIATGKARIAEIEKDRKALLASKPELVDTAILESQRGMLLERHKMQKEIVAQVMASLGHIEKATCSECGQKRPDKDIAAAKAELEKKQADAQKTMDEILVAGKKVKEDLEAAHAKNKASQEKFDKDVKDQLSVYDNEVDALMKDISEHEAKKQKLVDEINKELAELAKERQKVKEAGTPEGMKAYEEQLKDLRSRLTESQKTLQSATEAQTEHFSAKQREEKRQVEYKELIEKKDQLLESIDTIKTNIFYIKQYAMKKMEVLNEQISANLGRVSLELESFNAGTGEVKPCFNVLFDGRPIRVCSLSEQMKAGMEVIDMISSIKGYDYPLFLDNAESILSYETESSQVIEVRVEEGADLLSYGQKVTAPTRRAV